MNEEYQKSIEEEITLIKRENLKLKNDMEEMIITNKQTDILKMKIKSK